MLVQRQDRQPWSHHSWSEQVQQEVALDSDCMWTARSQDRGWQRNNPHLHSAEMFLRQGNRPGRPRERSRGLPGRLPCLRNISAEWRCGLFLCQPRSCDLAVHMQSESRATSCWTCSDQEWWDQGCRSCRWTNIDRERHGRLRGQGIHRQRERGRTNRRAVNHHCAKEGTEKPPPFTFYIQKCTTI